MRYKILVVDDKAENIRVLMEALKDDYALVAATSGEKALELARKEPMPDLILLDVIMPEMDGFQVCRELKADVTTQHIPVIFVTAQNEVANETMGLSLGAVDYLTKPVIPELVKIRVKNQLELYAYRQRLETMVEEQTHYLLELNDEIESTLSETLQTLGEIAEERSRETGHHVKRVMEYSYLLAKYLGLEESECELVRHASSMHDIGKMAIPDVILQKPGKLDKSEFQIMQEHSEYGYKMLGSSQRELFKAAAEVAFSHHEKWNGQGYPKGLKGEAIPLYGRIVALADVFDALGSDRCYKKAWDDERIFTLFKEERGGHFDPQLIDLFFAHLDEFLKIRDANRD